MSRAFGDYFCKENPDLPPEKQVITADPEIICHEITEDDEFLILACDGLQTIFSLILVNLQHTVSVSAGIWDCLTSQQVVDIVRYQISEGKSFSEIPGIIFDICLKPDDVGDDKGQDNMTMVLVALMHGRTKEEWYTWITDRVKSGYGYQTPTKLPQLYSEERVKAFLEKKAMREANERDGKNNEKADERELGDGSETEGDL
jgi:protein phosphatase 2C family protein 2/3